VGVGVGDCVGAGVGVGANGWGSQPAAKSITSSVSHGNKLLFTRPYLLKAEARAMAGEGGVRAGPLLAVRYSLRCPPARFA